MGCSDGVIAMRIRTVVVLAWATAVLLPLLLAALQLTSVAERGIIETLLSLEERFQTRGAMRFTLVISLLSTLVTVALALPVAWLLGRYRWPGHALLRGLFTTPFVTPSILAALGFLSLIEVLEWHRSEEVRLWTLLLAHAWFNLALVIRFTEPLLSTLDPTLEEAARLLPGGATRWGRMRRFWAPLLAPALGAAAAMTFAFSFTSFALVRHLTPGHRNLEVVMANQADWAGIAIPELGRTPSEVVLALSLVQLLFILSALGLSNRLSRRAQSLLRGSRTDARKEAKVWSWGGLHLLLMAAFTLAPIVAVFVGSFLILEWGELVFSLAGWETAFGGIHTGASLLPALISSLGYALLTLGVALPLGWVLASTIVDLEREGRGKAAAAVDLLAMAPLALSAVMVGLGVLIGLLRTEAEFLRSWWIIAFGHILITTPFATRVLLPAMRAQDPDLLAAAALLGAGPVRRLVRVRIPLMRPALIVAAALVLAISLGEFGASWVVVRFSEWTTLPVMVDDRLSRPGWDPVLRPAAHAAGTVLLLLTMVLFMAVERFRRLGEGGDF